MMKMESKVRLRIISLNATVVLMSINPTHLDQNDVEVSAVQSRSYDPSDDSENNDMSVKTQNFCIPFNPGKHNVSMTT